MGDERGPAVATLPKRSHPPRQPETILQRWRQAAALSGGPASKAKPFFLKASENNRTSCAQIEAKQRRRPRPRHWCVGNEHDWCVEKTKGQHSRCGVRGFRGLSQRTCPTCKRRNTRSPRPKIKGARYDGSPSLPRVLAPADDADSSAIVRRYCKKKKNTRHSYRKKSPKHLSL